MDLWTAAERLGIPFVVLTVFSWSCWRVIKWVGENVVKPIVKGYVSLVDESRESSLKNTETLEKIGNSMEEKAKAITKIASDHGQVLIRVNEIHAIVVPKKEA